MRQYSGHPVGSLRAWFCSFGDTRQVTRSGSHSNHTPPAADGVVEHPVGLGIDLSGIETFATRAGGLLRLPGARV